MRFAQLSDIHAAPGSPGLANLGQAIDWLRQVQLDAVVVTGDLVDDGWTEGYARVAQELSGLPCPLLVIPGNGDEPALLRSAFGQQTYWSAAEDALSFNQTIGGCSLIGLDVTVRGQSYGDVEPRLGYLANALANCAGDAVLFMHQPPIEIGIAPLDAVNCRNADKLLDVLDAAPVKPMAILCGHVHRPVIGTLGRYTVLTCGSIRPPNPLWFGDDFAPSTIDPPSLMIHVAEHGRLRSHFVALGPA